MGPWARGAGRGQGPDFLIFYGVPGGSYLAPARNLPLGELIGTSFGAVRGPIRPFFKIGPRRATPLGIEPGLGHRKSRLWAPGHQALSAGKWLKAFSAGKTGMGKTWTRTTWALCVRNLLESFKSFEILGSLDHMTLGFRPKWPPAVCFSRKTTPLKIWTGRPGQIW